MREIENEKKKQQEHRKKANCSNRGIYKASPPPLWALLVSEHAYTFTMASYIEFLIRFSIEWHFINLFYLSSLFRLILSLSLSVAHSVTRLHSFFHFRFNCQCVFVVVIVTSLLPFSLIFFLHQRSLFFTRLRFYMIWIYSWCRAILILQPNRK